MRCESYSPQSGVRCDKDEDHVNSKDPLKRSHEAKQANSVKSHGIAVKDTTKKNRKLTKSLVVGAGKE